MIESVDIENLRGIRRGKVTGLRPLTILVGPNGSGKSTVLDAILIGAHPKVGSAVGRVIGRRHDVDAARWMFLGGEAGLPAKIRIGVSGKEAVTAITLMDDAIPALEERLVRRQGGVGPFFGIEGESIESSGASTSFAVVADREGRYVYDESDGRTTVQMLRIVDSMLEFRSNPLSTEFQALRSRGAEASVQELTRQMIPGSSGLELGADSSGMATLHLTMPTGTLAISAAGDGVRLAIRLAIDLANVRKGIALLEEPEAHLHPAALGRVASVIIEAVSRGVQIVIATHSLELIDEVLERARERVPPSDLALVRVGLSSAVFASDTISGDAVYLAREVSHEDLR